MGRDTERRHTSSHYAGFNPRARMGRDEPGPSMFPIGSCFNPRARMGRDRRYQLGGRYVQCFNPRARMGRDSQ